MEDFIKHIVHALTDSSISLSRRTATIGAVIIVLILINDTFSFTFNYRIDKRLQQMEQLNKLYPVSMRDSIKLAQDLDDVAVQIRTKKPLLSQAKALYSGLVFNTISEKQKVFLLKLFSGSFVIVLCTVYALFEEKDEQGRRSIYVGMTILLLGLNIILLLIPTFSKPWINYLLNAFASIAVLAGLYFYVDSEEEEPTQSSAEQTNQ